MSRWNHSICDECWSEYFPHKRQAVRVINPKREYCCYCGQPHNSGIYVREDPSKIKCNGEHND